MNAKKNIQKKKAGPVFPYRISGNHGNFVTPAGKVSYLMTKATLRLKGKVSENDSESEKETSELTRFLRPVREVLDVASLGFDQLLQRDLDDNRIVYELIPYLLGSKRSGTPLFPPIVVMLLPYDGKQVSSSYSEIASKRIDNHDTYDGTWERTTFGKSFEFDRALEDAATPDFGILKWHNDHSRLIVLDGQHRAMALLGIQRIRSKDWPASAKRFEIFYKEAVEAMLSKSNNLPEVIELPVMLTWVPEKEVNLTEVVRKLFVDINHNARIPSPSRLLLLSDNQLSDFLIRRLLTEIRNDESLIPLCAVEYDYPNAGRSSSQKWSCFTNVEILKDLIFWSVLRARSLADNMKTDVMKKGKVAEEDIAMSLREELRVQSLGRKFEEGHEWMDSDEITNDHFPRLNKDKLEKLLNNFSEYHAKPLIALFSSTLPYQAHFWALKEFKSNFDKNHGSKSINPALCREALFEGQGVYWTIKAGADRSNELSACWNALNGELKKEFEQLRLQKYIGDSKRLNGRDKDFAAFFDTLKTSAAQGGLALLLRTIQRRAKKIEDENTEGERRVNLAKAIGDGISKGLQKNKGKNLLFLAPKAKGSLNRIVKLQPKFAGLWRYLWLETMVLGIGDEGLKNLDVDKEEINKLLNEGRKYYFKELIDMKKKELQSLDSSKKPEELDEEAQKLVKVEIIDAFESGCGLKKAEANKIWEAALNLKAQPSEKEEELDEEDENSDEEDWKEEQI